MIIYHFFSIHFIFTLTFIILTLLLTESLTLSTAKLKLLLQVFNRHSTGVPQISSIQFDIGERF